MFLTEPGIHPTAIVSQGAEIGEGTSIGAYSIIGPQVKLGRNNQVAAHVVIDGRTTLADDNTVYQFASVGAAPQDLKYRGELSTLALGNKNIIREYVTLQPGTSGGGMKTVIGDSNLFMANSHVGHDGILGNGNIIANSVALAGHVTLGNFCILGGLSAVHQFVRLGDYCLIGGGAMVVQDVPHYCVAQGDRAHLAGINGVGLIRRGFSKEDVQRIKLVYRKLFLGQGRMSERVTAMRAEFGEVASIAVLLDFVEHAARGVCAAGRGEAEES